MTDKTKKTQPQIQKGAHRVGSKPLQELKQPLRSEALKPAPLRSTRPKTSVVVLTTATGEPLVIRANPTDKAVREFVKEHSRRYEAGEPGGPAGHPAYKIYTAHRFESELAWLNREDPIGEIKISDLLP